MAKHIQAKTQAQKQRAALNKLKSKGLYKGKIDGRKKPSPAQLRVINRFKDVLSGKASVVKPKDPKSYKEMFRVVGDKVVVPRRKGEKIKVGKTGVIIGERKVAGRTVNTRFKRVKSDKDLSNKPQMMFAVPFIRGRDVNGDPILEWKRFPNKQILLDIMGGYETKQQNPYKNWQNYVVEESVNATDEELFDKLGAKRKQIRFKDKPKKRRVNRKGRNV